MVVFIQAMQYAFAIPATSWSK